jgi:hypothetical protein
MRPDEGQRAGTVMGVPKQAITDDGLSLPPLPDFAVDKPTPTSKKAVSSDPHMECKREKGLLLMKLDRRDHQIGLLKAKLATLERLHDQQRVKLTEATRENRELFKAEASARRAAKRMGKELSK